MTTTRPSSQAAPLAPEAILARILVGIDGTPQGFDACRQAARLAGPESVIEGATVVQLAPDLVGSFEEKATAALGVAGEILGPHAKLLRLYGFVAPELLAEAERFEATTIAIGSHGHPRIEEIVFGGNGGELLHQAACSVLVARPAPDVAAFPRSIVVGVDGSEESERAHAVASELARRHAASLRELVALEGKRVTLTQVVDRHPQVEIRASTPVRALVEGAACADLLVVGSRGLHGLGALGSVSERVAHRARCSVLVVR